MSSLSIMSKRIKIHQYQVEIGNVDEENVVIFRDVTFMSVTVIIQDFLWGHSQTTLTARGEGVHQIFALLNENYRFY